MKDLKLLSDDTLIELHKDPEISKKKILKELNNRGIMLKIVPTRVELGKHDVFCGRPGKWGNPFSHKEHSVATFKTKNRAESIAKHLEWLRNNKELLLDIVELEGKKLACFCNLRDSCHVDNIILVFKEQFNGLW